jgi:ABC-type transport system involved in cytochrome bd biosynthesis fused ATPase/permease subunit
MKTAIFFAVLALVAAVGLLSCGGYLIAFAAEHPPFAALSLGAVGVRFFGLSRGVFRYGERLVAHKASFALGEKIRERIYGRLLPLAPYRLGGRASGEILDEYAKQASLLEAVPVRVWLPVAVALFACLAGSVFWFLALPQMGILFCSIGLSLFVICFISYRTLKLTKKKESETRKELSRYLQTVSQNLADIQVAGYGARVSRAMASKADACERAQSASFWVLRGADFLCALALPASLLGVWAFGGAELPLPHLAALSLGTLAALEPLQNLPMAAAYMAESRVLRRVESVVGANHIRPSHAACLNIQNLSYWYPGSREKFFCETLKLSRGESFVLRGPSGSGKTALAGAIAGFVDFEGTLSRTENWTLVEQEPYLFTGTLADNLRLGRENASDAECLEALRLVDLESFALDTWLGEGGRAMSGGEMQRVALARAILRKADLIVADEACAHLPLAAEQKLFQIFSTLPQKPAVLWISHRLAEVF